jgi:hypothetical protein
MHTWSIAVHSIMTSEVLYLQQKDAMVNTSMLELMKIQGDPKYLILF